ncbi:alpha/beta fold hydrolase [Thauera sinica]|uniref:Alpha/beta fold hydrolase n=1 Tax=Thauera sinica TaxID=2665146 RepID=A0ABW1AUC6_9RHOO|nr:alpha/beta hydrolase [Thauera sp. K11]ATE59270.1 hypothetical protein CCZ27_04265 [Thauera sp. K11]
MVSITRGSPLARLLVATTMAALAGCAAVPGSGGGGSGRAIAGQKETAAYVRAGSSRTPAIVLQAGLQDDRSSWDKLMPGLARENMVIAIDRPGRGDNPATKAARDPCTIAAEQRALLRQAGVQPPYILVGHSLGGLYQYVYAKLYPDDVAGLVLLDPTHPRHWETMQKSSPRSADLIKVLRFAAFSSTDRAEFDAQAACLDRLDLAKPLGLPTRLLVSGRFRSEEQGAYQEMINSLRRDWLRLLGVPRLQTVWDSGHYIQKDSPEEVLAAVKGLAADLQRSRPNHAP